MDTHLQERLRAAYPAESDGMLIRALQEGVALADDAVSGLAFLRTAAGQDIRGFLRRAGVMYAINEYCMRGDLPFETEFEKQTRGNWHWMNMKASNVTAHVVKTPALLGFPREAPTRQDKRLTNNGDLFNDEKILPFDKVIGRNSPLYAWLGYGTSRTGEITHAFWGIPAVDEDVYLAHTDVLNSANAQIMSAPASSAVAPEVKLSFKKHIQEIIEANDDSAAQ